MDDIILRICFIGADGSGKTRLGHFLTTDEYYVPNSTLGVDFYQSSIKVNDKNIKYSIWDTAGFSNFYSIIRSYFNLSCAFVIVTDLTDARYYTSVLEWTNNIIINENIKDRPIFLFCNTRGKENEYKYRIDQLTNLAERQNLTMVVSDIKKKNDGIEIIEKISLHYIDELNNKLKGQNKEKRDEIICNYSRKGVIVKESFYKALEKKKSWLVKFFNL